MGDKSPKSQKKSKGQKAIAKEVQQAKKAGTTPPTA